MNILVVMAGEGNRFKEVGIDTPKPLIEVNDKSILEWTTRSLPFIQHKQETSSVLPILPDQLYFAIRKEHESNGICEYLKSLYGDDVNFIVFENTTRGNLETALISCISIHNIYDPLLVLDCDNMYCDNHFLETLIEANQIENSMVVTCFEPLDNSDKWSFVVPNGRVATEIVEKDGTALSRGGKPLVGTFWFQNTLMFMESAAEIIQSNAKTGQANKQEFYISQVPQKHINTGKVFVHMVDSVVPLGTPEDVEKFRSTT